MRRSFPKFWGPILWVNILASVIAGFPALALIADTKVSVLALPNASFDVPPPELGKLHNQIKNSKWWKVQESTHASCQ